MNCAEHLDGCPGEWFAPKRDSEYKTFFLRAQMRMIYSETWYKFALHYTAHDDIIVAGNDQCCAQEIINLRNPVPWDGDLLYRFAVIVGVRLVPSSRRNIY